MTPVGAVVAPAVVVGHISMLEWKWKRGGGDHNYSTVCRQMALKGTWQRDFFYKLAPHRILDRNTNVI